MTDTPAESKRIKAFRTDLIKQIPRFPNDKASKQAMEAKHLTDLLISYIGWRVRYVAPRPRTVTGLDILAADTRAAALAPNIASFVKTVQAGDDLTPYLSLLPHKHGYTPSADPKGGGDSWADKDFLLNVMGLHHFHLGLVKETKGHMARTDEVIFASVTRDKFEVIGLFDHDAFEHEPDGTMTLERQKLWSVFESREKSNLLPGQLSAGGLAGLGITTSSVPVAVVRAAQRHVDIIKKIDPKLDDPAYVRGLYDSTNVPEKPRPHWFYNYLDFGLIDEKTSFFGVLEYGPN